MNVTISVFGRFHAFYLARELEQRGHLRRLITSHPQFSVNRWGVSKANVKSLWPIETMRQFVNRLPVPLAEAVITDRGLHRIYETYSSRSIPEDTDLFVGWSGASESGLERAKELGARTIVERCSSHIRTQREILRDEYERHGVDARLPSERTVEKEEREYEAADFVAVPSCFVERTFRKRGFPAERLLRIPYGVDKTEFEPVDKKDDRFRVVFAGQIGYRKGVQYLLQAWDDLDLPNGELLLLGPVREEFHPLMEKYQDSYRHPGSVPQKTLDSWYSQGTVFVLPSVEEGMAYVQLQAMACGLPLICTPNTGGEDLIREGREGFVVPIRDVEALKERILWCRENQEECRMMGLKARQRVLEQFTWCDYGRRVVENYSSLLGRET